MVDNIQYIEFVYLFLLVFVSTSYCGKVNLKICHYRESKDCVSLSLMVPSNGIRRVGLDHGKSLHHIKQESKLHILIRYLLVKKEGRV